GPPSSEIGGESGENLVYQPFLTSRWLNEIIMLPYLWLRRSLSHTAARPPRRRPGWRPRLAAPEGRTVPAATVTVIARAAGAGSLDGFLGPTDGTLTAADGGDADGTLSAGALQGVAANVDLSIAAQTAIVFNSNIGLLALPTAAGHGVTFSSGTGDISFGDAAAHLSLTTAGAALTFDAGGGLAVGNLDSGGGAAGLPPRAGAPALPHRPRGRPDLQQPPGGRQHRDAQRGRRHQRTPAQLHPDRQPQPLRASSRLRHGRRSGRPRHPRREAAAHLRQHLRGPRGGGRSP